MRRNQEMSLKQIHYRPHRTTRQMQPIATDGVAWSVGLSVGLSVTTVSPAKAAEPIVIPFVMLTRVTQGTV